MRETKIQIAALLSILLAGIACLVVAAALQPDVTTEWIEKPVERFSGFYGEEIGLRSDGVVAWRKKWFATNNAYSDGIRTLPPTTNAAPIPKPFNDSQMEICWLLRDATNFISATTGNITNTLTMDQVAVKKAAKDGKLCEVFGHTWDSHIHNPKEDKPGTTGCRHCKFCDLHQYRYMKEEWK